MCTYTLTYQLAYDIFEGLSSLGSNERAARALYDVAVESTVFCIETLTRSGI